MGLLPAPGGPRAFDVSPPGPDPNADENRHHGGALFMPWEEPPPERRFNREGMRVLLEPIPGLTKPGLIDLSGLRFQCPPLDEFSANYSHSHTDYDTIGAQHSRAGVPQLATVQFNTLVVDWGTFVVDVNAPEIEEIRDTLKEICLSGSPVLLTCAHQLPAGGYSNWSLTLAGPEVQMPATLRSLKVSEKAGEPDARYLDVSFTEYSSPKTSRKAFGSKRTSDNKLPMTVYLYADGHAEDKNGVKLADPPAHPLTLSWLARHYYKDPSLARTIGRANGLDNYGLTDALIKHPRYKAMKKGQRLKIIVPKKPGQGAMVAQLEDKVVEAVAWDGSMLVTTGG